MEIREVVLVYELVQPRATQWHTRYHSHAPDEYEIHYVVQGRGRFKSEHTLHTLGGGSVVVCRPLESHQIHDSDPVDPLSYYAVLFRLGPDDHEVRALLETALVDYPRINLGTHHRFFFEELKERAEAENPLIRQSAAHQFLSFVYLLAGTLDSLKADPRSKGVSNFHIERALGIMQRQVFSDLSVADLARRLGLDSSYFIRLFRRTLKLSPKQYMIKLKIEAGASMLISSPRPIYEIADLLHFSSEFHFSRAFKQHTSLPPRTYREVHKQVTPDVL